MLTAFLTALTVVFLAEIGDKSLLLAMAFGARHRLAPVVLGVVTASILAVGLAVAVGDIIRRILPEHVIAYGAAGLFLAIGLTLVLRPIPPEQPTERDTSNQRFFAVYATVVSAFVLAEVGDKTMLMVVTLAASQQLTAVYGGAVVGMAAASTLGAVFANRLAHRVKPIVIERIAGAVFLVTGTLMAVRAFAAF